MFGSNPNTVILSDLSNTAITLGKSSHEYIDLSYDPLGVSEFILKTTYLVPFESMFKIPRMLCNVLFLKQLLIQPIRLTQSPTIRVLISAVHLFYDLIYLSLHWKV